MLYIILLVLNFGLLARADEKPAPPPNLKVEIPLNTTPPALNVDPKTVETTASDKTDMPYYHPEIRKPGNTPPRAEGDDPRYNRRLGPQPGTYLLKQ